MELRVGRDGVSHYRCNERPTVTQDRFNPSLAMCVFLLLDAAVVQPRVVQTVGRNSTLLYKTIWSWIRCQTDALMSYI